MPAPTTLRPPPADQLTPYLDAAVGRPLVATKEAKGLDGFRAGAPIGNAHQVAKLFDSYHKAFAGVTPRHRERVVLAQGRKTIGRKLGADPVAARMLLDVLSEDVLVASGGCCAPCVPFYDFYGVAVPASPVEDSLPTIGAPRGCVQYMGCTDWRSALPGITAVPCPEDDDETPPKSCVSFECPDVETAETVAVSRCATFDNLSNRTFPELTRRLLANLAIAQTAAKERLYLDCMSAAATTVTVDSGRYLYGAYRSLFDFLAVAAVRYRHRHAMAPRARLNVYLPAWVRDAAATDLVNDGRCCGAPRAYTRVDAAFRQLGLSVTWWRDLDPATGHPAEPQPGNAEGLDWPTTATGLLHAPGTFARLDAGTLDIGTIREPVRDSTLNRSNDFQVFAEEWVGCAFVGCESIAFELTLCPHGGGAPYTDLKMCS